MAALTSIPFAMQKGGTGIAQNSNETLINMYAEMSSGRSDIIRRQRPCLRSLYAIEGEKRCIERYKGLHYVIIGPTVYTFDGVMLVTVGVLSYTVNSRTVYSTSGRCSMIFNDVGQCMISDGQRAWYFSITFTPTIEYVTTAPGVPGGGLAYVGGYGTMTLVTTDPEMTVGHLTYLGGYGIANDAGTGKFYSTPANDFTQFDALDFATAEAAPDDLYRVYADHGELWLAGERTIEIWQLSGLAAFPFQAVPQARIERGIAAPFSMASEDNTVIWLGDDKTIYRGDGYRPNRISTDAIEEAIKLVSAVSVFNAYAMLRTIGGKKFYTLTFPNELSISYNFATGLWNEDRSYGYNSWNVTGSNGHYSDYYLTPAGVCDLSTDINQDEGGPCVRVARSAPGDANLRLITMNEFEVDCEVGRAATGVKAEVMLRVALNAETFGNYRVRSVGGTGQYRKRVIWRSLGQGRKPVLELSASDDFSFAIMRTMLNATVANS